MWLIFLIILIFLLCCDWYQTYQIATTPAKWYETNPILGHHPKPFTVHLYFLAVIICTCIGVLIIPEPYKTIGPIGFCFIEGWFIMNNRTIGIH